MRSDGRTALTQPLVSRPGYNEGGSPALPRGTVSESKLPSGPPADRGLSLDDSVPGTSTFAKPEDDIREDGKSEPGSIYKVDGPGNRAKPQDDAEPGDERDHSGFKPTHAPAGGRGEDDTSLTKYPYRDGIPNTHNASVAFVAGLYALDSAPEHVLRAGSPFETRTAAKLDDILSGLNPKVNQSASKCSATMKRADIKNLRWIFSVDCGNGPKVVRMKAVRKGNVVKLELMDLVLSCSCPAWRWLGSEHHSKREHYLDGKPRGTAWVPAIKDPTNINRVCKHVAAALSQAKGWTIPVAKKPKPKTKTAADAFKRACGVCLAIEATKDEVFEDGLLLTDLQPPVLVRAVGNPEFSPAVYQVRGEGQDWPSQWKSTDDLAGALSRLGRRARCL